MDDHLARKNVSRLPDIATPPRSLPRNVRLSSAGGSRVRPAGAIAGTQCDHVLMLEEPLSWAEVAARLAAARNYWLCTTMPSGAPHAAPVWGVVGGCILYLYSERRTVKARNLAADPRVVVHLESGEDVVIVRGIAEDLGPPAQVPDVVQALAAKYTSADDQHYLPHADPDFDVVYAIRPQSAMMWHLADYENSQRRWVS